MSTYPTSVAMFDRWAPSYDHGALQPVLYGPVHSAVLRHAVRLAVAPTVMLDVGCGTGRLLRAAGRVFAGCVRVGVDTSAVMLATATMAGRRNGSGVRFVLAGVECLPFADATFDLVLSTISYRHWRDQTAGIGEIGRVCASGGIVGIADVFGHRRRRRMLLGLAGAHEPLPAELDAALASARLAPITVETLDGFGPVPGATIVMARRE